MSACMCMFVCVCMCAYQRTSGVIPLALSTLYLRYGLLLVWTFSIRLGWPASPRLSACLYLFSPGITGIRTMPGCSGSPSWVLESKLMSSCSQGKHFTNKAISSVLLLGKLDTSTGDWLDLVIATPTDAPLGGLGGPRRKQQHPLGWDVQSGATLVLKEKPYSSPTHTVHPRS